MRRTKPATVLLTLVLGTTAAANHGPTLRCAVKVPQQYQVSSRETPNGESESVRYTVAYEAYWWNCVAVRAKDLAGRCPFVANGTPGASAGAADGAMNADDQIDGLLKKYPRQTVRVYLRSLADQASAKTKMQPYFSGRPTSESPK